jgi:uncharacterized protein YndB with AHSA1/START domain
MIDIDETVYIDLPIEKVFEFTTDLNNNIRWQTDVSVAEQTSDGPLGLGATYRCVNRFLGQRLETEGYVSRFEPHRVCTFRFTSGGVGGESSFLFEPVNGGTRVTTRARLNLEKYKLAGFLLNYKAKKQVRTDLLKLKTLLENGGSAS